MTTAEEPLIEITLAVSGVAGGRDDTCGEVMVFWGPFFRVSRSLNVTSGPQSANWERDILTDAVEDGIATEKQGLPSERTASTCFFSEVVGFQLTLTEVAADSIVMVEVFTAGFTILGAALTAAVGNRVESASAVETRSNVFLWIEFSILF